jgi:hypothetical protein
MSDTYNPADYKVSEVLAHLEEVDDEERRRIHAAESVGKARAGILGAVQLPADAAESVGKARAGILGAVQLPADCGRPVYTNEGLCRQRILHPEQWECQRCEGVELPDVPRSPTQMTIAHNKQKLAEQVEAMSDEDRAEFERRRARRRTADGSPSTPEPAEPAPDDATTAEQES